MPRLFTYRLNKREKLLYSNKKMDEKLMESVFLDSNFIHLVYGSILKYYYKEKKMFQ
jgi:hypothetical protein